MAAEDILVPLHRHGRIEEVIPYIEKIARAGMRVVFRVPYPLDTQGNRAAAARLLGLHKTHLLNLMKSLGID
jgi:transcriptional regulator with GAF, ATPase, and Fis domain